MGCLELDITGIGAGGEGVGRVDGQVVFVPFALPGERVAARITHRGKRRLIAETEKVLTASPHRVVPVCPVFERCGGCQLLHVEYTAQLDLKRQILKDALRSVAGLEFDRELPIQAASRPLGYRNRGQYPVTLSAGRVATGFFAPRSHQVVPVDACQIHEARLDQAVKCVRDWATRKKIPVYDEQSGRGFLRHVVVRGAGAPNQILVALVGARDRGGSYGDLVRRLRRSVPDVSGVVLNLNPRRTNVILGKQTRLLWGRPWIEERLQGLRFRLSLGSFFQVHSAQAEVLFARVADFLGEPDGEVVDAYCGVGVLGMVLAQRGHRVVGIEVNRGALEDAREAASRNRLEGIRFQAGRVETVLPGLIEKGLSPSAVVLDPPRKGCAPEVLEAVARSRTPRIAYVSCHPGTLARDLAALLGSGYCLEQLEAVDMFPQTSHLEVLAGLVRR